MIKRLLNRLSLSRILSILVLSLLLPSTTWAEDTEPPITVAGIEPDSDGVFINGNGTQISGVTYTDNTLSLSGANIDGNIISNTEALTINFQGTNTINGSLYINNQIEGTLSFTGSDDATLTLDNSGSGSVIYNFKSVDFGGFNLATTSSPGIFYIVDEPNGNPNQLWSNNIMGYASNVTLTKKTIYPLWIGKYTSDYYQTFTQITEDNYSDIFGDSKISFDRDHTLTLSGATITGSIISGLSSLNIIVDKNNSIQIKEDSATCIRNIKPGATLTLQKEQNSDMASLTVQGSSLIRGFNPISYNEGGLKLFAYNRTYQESTPVDLLIPNAYYDYEYDEFRSSSDNIVSYVKFSTEIPIMIGNTPVTRQNPINASDNNDDDILGSVGSVALSVDENNNNILTIDNLQTGGKDIVSTLPNLTIKYKGSCDIGKIISNNSDAALTFGLAEGANDEDKCYFSLSNELPWEGFSGNPTFNNTIVYIPGADSHYITKLKSPDISIEEGIYLTSQDQFEYAGNDAISFYYTIDYVDESKVDVSTPQKYEGFTPDHPFTISDPAILSVYAHYNYMDRELNSGNAIGKYFGFASNTVETTYSEEVKLPTISPTLPESIRPYYMVQEGGNTAGVTFNEETGTITGYSNIGEATVNVELRYDEYPNFTILNERENDFENLGNFTLTIVPKSLTNDMIQAIADQTYAGTALTPDIKVKDGEKTLTLGTDYEVSYKQDETVVTSPTNAGSYNVIVTGKGNYTGTATKTFTIVAKDIATATVTLDPEQTYTYTSSAIEPNISSVSIKLTEGADAATILTAEMDYTVSYTNNINAATAESDNAPTVTITGKGNYSGTKDVYFTINKGSAGLQFYRMNGDQASPVNTIQSATYGVAFDTPLLANPHELSITYSSKASNSLEATNSDVVTIDSDGNITLEKIGRAYIFTTTPGNENYEEDTVSYVLDVNPGNLANVTIAEISDTTYNGLEIKPEIIVTLNGKTVSSDDYTVSYSNNINVSTDAANKATITLTAKSTSEHFAEGTTKTATFNIVAKSFTNDMIQAIADQTYSFGNAITPTVTVKDGETTLTLATTADDTGDYSIAYSNNTNAAKSTDETAPTVTITGKGNYTGTASKTFTINPMAVATATISLSDATLTYNGAAQHPTISSIEGNNSEGSTLEFTSSDYIISYEQNDNTLTADDVKNAGGYTLVAIFGGNYSGTATTTFNIAAKDLSDAATIATIPDQTYTGNEIKPEPAVSIVLIDGNDATTLTKGTDFDYSYANNINASEQAEVQPTVTITGKGNYTGSASQTFSITNATMTVTATGYNGTYDGNTHGITVTAPEGATVKYGTKKGTYDLDASPTYTDAGSYMVHYQVVKTNYATIADSAKVEITKATPSITFDEESYTATYGAEFTAPTASTNPEGLTVTATSSSNTQVAAVADGVITITGIGETTITVSFAGNNNYEAATTTYKLNVAAGAITGITATGYTGTYDGNAHGITVTAPEGASIKYGTKKGTYDLDASPTYTDAGSYMVHYQVERTNYATITDSAKVEITKATPSITFDKESYSATYGEAFTAPTASTNPEGLTVTATSSSNTQVATISDGVITIVGVGETTITVSFAGSNNYEATTATYKLNVAAGTIIGVTATGYSDVYDGKAHGITVTAPEGATIKYGTKKGTYNLDQSPTFSDAGTYMVHYQVECTNYTTLIDSVKVEITKVNITPSITLEGWTYGTTANTPVVTGNTGNGVETFTYKAEGSEAFTSEVPTAVGTHTVKVTIGETTNYNGGEATTTFAITNRTIDPAKDITFAEGQSYASFYSANEDLVLPESGIAVYMITGIEVNTLITQAVSYIPKGVPVLIEKTETAVEAKDPSEVGTNMLQYATEDVAASGTLYILYNGEYVKATGTIPQGKCYLKLNKPSGARILTIGNNNGTTSISNFNADTETDRWFDLNGQRISKPQKKGLYIKNGKKIVVK